MIKINCPLATIAIPTYNRADSYLRHALESALKQTYQNIEIIVSDNCSNDNTALVVKGYVDPRIRYFKHEKNIGANNNFNFCLKEARGDYFLLLQDDDLIDNNFVEVCIRAAQSSKDIGFIRTGIRIIDSEGKVLYESLNMVGGVSTDEFFIGWFKGRTSLYLCSTLFNTERLREVGGFRSKRNLVQDGVAIVRLLAQYNRADIEDIKASFRKHPAEMTFLAKISDWCEDYLELLDLMCALFSENRKLIKSEGMRFFSTLNYNRARAVKSPIRRFIAYLIVFKKFNYRYLPSTDHFRSPIYHLLYGTHMYYGMRYIKRKIKQIAG